MKILGLSGSLRSESLTCNVVKIALKKLEPFDTELIDLRHYQLPFCDGSVHYPSFPDVVKLRSAISGASGIIVATPEYHGSISGVLKNALDLLDEEHVKNKVVGLISLMGGVTSSNAINTMRIIFRQLNAFVINEQVIVPYAEQMVSGLLLEKSLDLRLDALVKQLIAIQEKFAR